MVDAIWVSNHGGRHTDESLSTIELLQSIAAAVGGKIPILFDGGVRSGYDALKAFALGADYVFAGRPFVYGLGSEGQEGVVKVMDLMEEELLEAMVICGVRSVKEARSKGILVKKARL